MASDVPKAPRVPSRPPASRPAPSGPVVLGPLARAAAASPRKAPVPKPRKVAFRDSTAGRLLLASVVGGCLSTATQAVLLTSGAVEPRPPGMPFSLDAALVAGLVAGAAGAGAALRGGMAARIARGAVAAAGLALVAVMVSGPFLVPR